MTNTFYDSCSTSNMGKLLRANNALQGWHFVTEMGWYENTTETMEDYLDTLENITTTITPEAAFRDVLKIGFEKNLDNTTITDSVSYRLNSVLKLLFPDSTFDVLTVKDESYSTSQTDDLEEIAEKCPFEYGQAVYMARAMLSEMDTIPNQYKHECELFDGGSGKWDGQEEENETIAGESERIVKVYPNPTTNSLFIELNLLEGETGIIKFYSVSGSHVVNSTLQAGKTELNLYVLSAGLYHYGIYVNNERVLSGKQVIVK